MKKEKEEKNIKLAKGSVYQLTTIGSRNETLVTKGTFVGYTSIGSDEGICIQLDDSHGDLKDKVRVIPLHMILAIDILQQKEEDDKPGTVDDRTAHYFG